MEAAGELRTAHRELERGLELFAALPMPLAHGEALLVVGDFLRRRGEPTQARTFVKRALDIASGCGAHRLARHGGELLALAGGRRRSRRIEANVLTPAESRVIELVEAGLSNAEIAGRISLSVRTVESHIAHAFAKLGVSSRRELLARRAIHA